MTSRSHDSPGGAPVAISTRERVARYAWAVGFAVLATLVRLAFEEFGGVNTRLVLFFPAILAAALWLGIGPALACTALSTALVAWIWMEPEGSPAVASSGDLQALLLFVASGVAMTLLVETHRGGRAQARAKTLVQRLSREVTQREEELREREARMQAVVENAVEAIITIDERGTIHSFNIAAERIFGYASDEVVGRNVRMLMPTPYREEHDGYVSAYLATGVKKIIGIGREVTAVRKDGTVFPADLAVSEVPLDDRRLFTGFIRDLTEQKRLEREFLQAQKMEAVGNLSGGIAHDFNNLLMGILACSRIAGESLERDSQARELFQEIGAAANRGIALTRRLLAFSRKSPVQLHPTSIDAVVRENETMLRQLLGEDVALVIDLRSGSACVRADEGLVDQVLINLLVNARDAMPAGGEIRVATLVAADEVVLEVRDSGSGIPPEVRARIFEPFFTTKAADKGTGLGLSTVKRIVEQLAGRIELESEVGRGTAFRLVFPCTAGEAAAAPAGSAPAPAAAPAGKTVLLVEDDRLVRVALQRFLGAKGYSVVAAGTPAEALDLARDRSDIDVLVTDMILPGITGSELAKRLREARPELAAVFMSAHPAELLIEQGRLSPGAPYIEKPFEMEELERVLCGLLGVGAG